MKHLGLVSVSFRQLTPEEVILCAQDAGLRAIEWGADIHCKPGDAAAAAAVYERAAASGLDCAAYGSYYRVGAADAGNAAFEDILDTADALKAGIIRVWAYNKGSAEVDAAEYAGVVADMKRICAMAAERSMKISLECHNNTLTDDYNSALRLLDAVSAENLTMYWQPNQFKSDEYNRQSAKELRDYVTNVHVFNWKGKEKYPLAGAMDLWKSYIALLEGARYEHDYLLEFMPNGTPQELPSEAQALKGFFLS